MNNILIAIYFCASVLIVGCSTDSILIYGDKLQAPLLKAKSSNIRVGPVLSECVQVASEAGNIVSDEDSLKRSLLIMKSTAADLHGNLVSQIKLKDYPHLNSFAFTYNVYKCPENKIEKITEVIESDYISKIAFEAN